MDALNAETRTDEQSSVGASTDDDKLDEVDVETCVGSATNDTGVDTVDASTDDDRAEGLGNDDGVDSTIDVAGTDECDKVGDCLIWKGVVSRLNCL